MNDERYPLPKTAYDGYVCGARKRGRPKKRWINMIRAVVSYARNCI